MPWEYRAATSPPVPDGDAMTPAFPIPPSTVGRALHARMANNEDDESQERLPCTGKYTRATPTLLEEEPDRQHDRVAGFVENPTREFLPRLGSAPG